MFFYFKKKFFNNEEKRLSNGVVSWCNKDGLYHRDGDLPAVIFFNDGYHHWYKNGQRHRDNGLPAVVHLNEIHNEWWENGTFIRISLS